MSMRFLTATAVAVLLAAPAFADCEAEIASLDEAVLAAETAAGLGSTGMMATKHQGEAQDLEPAAGASAGTDVATLAEPVTVHQRAVLAHLRDANSPHPSSLLSAARKMAADGDEAGCMARVEEARALLGLEG